MPATKPRKLMRNTGSKNVAAIKKTPKLKVALAVEPVSAPRKEYQPVGEHLEAFIKEIAGKDGMRIIETIGDEGCTDEAIEQKTEIKIAEVRCLLNHLHSYGVVEYKREKNLQNGWFTYTWNLNRERALSNYLQMKKKEYDDLRARVAYAENTCVYKCRKGCIRCEFDDAMENQFRCPKCKGMLRYESNDGNMRKIVERVKSMEKLISDFSARPAVTTESSPAREVMVAALKK
jgi:transcription initiation factor TFIIE subunit alpha